VRLIISDACIGLVESVAKYYPEADWQRCMVHFYRNVFSHAPSTKVKQVNLILKAIHAQQSLQTASDKATQVVQSLRDMKLKTAADLVEQKICETLAYYRYPANPPDTHLHQQSAGKNHAGDPATHARGWRVP
jgi:putative transposase